LAPVPPRDHLEDWHEILILAAADRCGLLSQAAEGAAPDAAAAALALDRRAVRVVYEALEGLGYVERSDGAFALNDRGRRLLGPQPDESDPVADVRLSERAIRQHLRLPEVLRTGVGVDDVSGGPPEEIAGFSRAMRHVASRRAPEVVAAVGPPPPGGRLLDVGGAPGLYARAFAAAGWSVTVLDLPDPLSVAGDLLKADGIATVAGDMTVELPPGPWDCAFLGNVTHLFSPETAARVLRLAGAGLAPGGLLAVGDMVRDRSPRAAQFAVLMLVASRTGDTYRESQYREWMAAAGCPLERVVDIDGGWHQLLLGRRAV